MPRQSYDEQRAIVEALVGSGEMTHQAVVDGLNAQGQGHIARLLLKMVQNGDLVGSVKAQPGGSPVLSYSLPALPEAAPPQAAPAAPAAPAPAAPAGGE